MLLQNQADPLNLKSFGYHLASSYLEISTLLAKLTLKCPLKLANLSAGRVPWPVHEGKLAISLL